MTCHHKYFFYFENIKTYLTFNMFALCLKQTKQLSITIEFKPRLLYFLRHLLHEMYVPILVLNVYI